MSGENIVRLLPPMILSFRVDSFEQVFEFRIHKHETMIVNDISLKLIPSISRITVLARTIPSNHPSLHHPQTNGEHSYLANTLTVASLCDLESTAIVVADLDFVVMNEALSVRIRILGVNGEEFANGDDQYINIPYTRPARVAELSPASTIVELTSSQMVCSTISWLTSSLSTKFSPKPSTLDYSELPISRRQHKMSQGCCPQRRSTSRGI